jgi:DNA (cytosine-5)-methyltransferase 1
MPDKGRMQMVVQPFRMTAFGQYEDDDSGSTCKQRDYKDATDLVVQPVCATGHRTHTLKAEGFDGSEDGTGRGTPIVPHDVTGTLSSRATAAGGLGTDFEVAGGLQAVDVYNGTMTGDVAATLNASTGASANHSGPSVLLPTMAVRRLLPVECERLQGFPDDWTLIPWRGKPTPDGPRYKAMGNSMAVPVMRWIGQRLDRVAKEKR